MPRYELATLVELVGLDKGLLYQVIERQLVAVQLVDEQTVELDESQLARLRRIRRLIEDFDLNVDALELVLELRDAVERLQRAG